MDVFGVARLDRNDQLSFRATYSFPETGSSVGIQNRLDLRGPSAGDGRFSQHFGEDAEVNSVGSNCGGGILKVEYFAKGWGGEGSGGWLPVDPEFERWTFQNSLEVRGC